MNGRHGKIVVSEAANIEKYDVQYNGNGWTEAHWMDLSAMGTEAAVTSDAWNSARPTTSVCGPRTTIGLVRPVGFHGYGN